MKVRLIALLPFAAVLLSGSGWPSDGWAQQKVPRIGGFLLGIETEAGKNQNWKPFNRALQSDGWIVGENVGVVYASLRGDTSRYPEAVAELVRQKVDLIWADSAPAVRAAFAATRTIPILAQDFTTDPVAEGGTVGKRSIWVRGRVFSEGLCSSWSSSRPPRRNEMRKPNERR